MASYKDGSALESKLLRIFANYLHVVMERHKSKFTTEMGDGIICGIGSIELQKYNNRTSMANSALGNFSLLSLEIIKWMQIYCVSGETLEVLRMAVGHPDTFIHKHNR